MLHTKTHVFLVSPLIHHLHTIWTHLNERSLPALRVLKKDLCEIVNYCHTTVYCFTTVIRQIKTHIKSEGNDRSDTELKNV